MLMRLAPVDPRRAYVDDFALRIGQRATLLPSAGSRAYGMVFTLTHSELERLYTAPDLEPYRPEGVLAQSSEGTAVPALWPRRVSGLLRHVRSRHQREASLRQSGWDVRGD